MRKVSHIIPILVLVGTVTVLNTPASAVGRNCAYFEFDKAGAASPQGNVNSDLKWRYVDQFGRCVNVRNYRAGSGDTQDPCQVNHGWLPNGWYDLGNEGHIHNRNGALIDGRVWDLQDKACNGGTMRTELFIHTEEEADNTQTCSPASADSPRCWDDTRAFSGADVGTNDYFSEGCIKVRRMSPEGNWANDMADIHSDWHNLGAGSGGHGSGRTDSLLVVS
jgi:hypothetical protein